ncbi:MAG: ParA family protein [Lentisphaerae bacterium]|nr:ParA family protein [Lentisphaerota bacterium]
MGKAVLVVDLDPQANTTSGFGGSSEGGGSLYRALLGSESANDKIRDTGFEGVHIIPSELDLAGAEIDVARMEGYLHRFTSAIDPVARAGQYDVILVDCPPSLGILTMNALAGADGALIPIQCEYYALEGLSVITRLVRQLRDSGANQRLRIEGVLMTMYDGRTKLSAEVVEEVRKHFTDKVYRTVIPRNVRLSEAPSHGKPITEYDRTCSGAAAYRLLAREFYDRISPSASMAVNVAPPPPSEGA